MGPPRPGPIAAAAGALREPSARPPEDAVLVRPGASVQQALESCGGWVVLARGLHRLPAPLRVPGGVTLAGQGFDSILWLDPTLTGPALVNDDEHLRDVTLRDFVIEGATASDLPSDPNADRRRRARPGAPARAGIQLVAKDDGRMEGVRLEHFVVRNCTATGVRIEGASGVVVEALEE